MLRWRFLAAAAILIPLAALLVADTNWNFGLPGIWLIPVGWLLTVMAAAEVLDLLRDYAPRPSAWTVYVGVSLVFVGAFAPQPALPLARAQACAGWPAGSFGWTTAALALSAVLVFLDQMCRFRAPGDAMLKVALAIFAIVYPGLFMSLLAQLRLVRPDPWGMAALVSLVFVVKMSDVGAYTVGKLFGRRKMAPFLSPGKTVEGLFGGLSVAVVSSWFFFCCLMPLVAGHSGASTTWRGACLYGVVVGAAGVVGDLAESLLKRDMRRKDSSRWLPGLGGVLDVLDSLLMAAPAALFCWAAGIVGPAS